MAKARAIIKRRKAVDNIRKITRTMELIATARYRKAMDRATEAEAYTRKIAELASDLVGPLIDRVSHGYLRWMQSDNSLDPIREHPRFAALMQRAADRLAREDSTAAGTAAAARSQNA